MFLTASDSELVGGCYTLPPELRNLYEVIWVDTPRGLYLDVEFKRDLNRDVSEDTVISTLKTIFVEAINMLIPGVNSSLCSIVDLVATTERKMSHLIMFLTASDSEFVGWYYTLPPELRNLYEVIRVDTPRRL